MRKIHINRIIQVILLLSVLMLASCGKIKEINADELATELLSGVPFSETLTEIDVSAADQMLMLNPSNYSDIKMYVGTLSTCDCIAIINAKNTSVVEEKLGNYIASKRAKYLMYRPAEVSKLDNAYITEYKGTVVMVISNDPVTVETVYKNYLKK